MSHTAGIPDRLRANEEDDEDEDGGSPAAALRTALSLPLDFAPGTQRRYSNSGFTIARLVIMRAGSAENEPFVRDKVLAPAGVTRAVMEAAEPVAGETGDAPVVSRRQAATQISAARRGIGIIAPGEPSSPRAAMPTFLSDPPFVVYALLVIAAAVCIAVWLNRRDVKGRLAVATALALLIAVIVIDRLFESPREEAVRRVQAMARAADQRDPEGFLSHVADRIEYQGQGGQPRTVTRDDLRRSGAWSAIQSYDLHVATWDFDRNDVAEIDPNTIEIGFLGKAETRADGKQIPIYFRARFTRQPDGAMKMTGLASYDAIRRTNERKGIPNFP